MGDLYGHMSGCQGIRFCRCNMVGCHGKIMFSVVIWVIDIVVWVVAMMIWVVAKVIYNGHILIKVIWVDCKVI